MRIQRVLPAAALVGVVASASVACHGGPRGEHPHVLSIVREEAGASAPAASSSLPHVETAAAVPAHTTSGVAPFLVLARQPRLTKAPCTSCHTQPLAAMRWNGSDGRATAHWQIELAHAPASVMRCTTCHAGFDLTQLQMLSSDAVPFDHAYEVCAQCHSKQKADWEGGAHGKRAGGWTPPRVVYNCTECHNPHRPAFPSRWPAHAGRSAGDR